MFVSKRERPPYHVRLRSLSGGVVSPRAEGTSTRAAAQREHISKETELGDTQVPVVATCNWFTEFYLESRVCVMEEASPPFVLSGNLTSPNQSQLCVELHHFKVFPEAQSKVGQPLRVSVCLCMHTFPLFCLAAKPYVLVQTS